MTQQLPTDGFAIFVKAECETCAMIEPVFPTTGLGENVVKDGSGRFALVSTSAFVQEPR